MEPRIGAFDMRTNIPVILILVGAVVAALGPVLALSFSGNQKLDEQMATSPAMREMVVKLKNCRVHDLLVDNYEEDGVQKVRLAYVFNNQEIGGGILQVAFHVAGDPYRRDVRALATFVDDIVHDGEYRYGQMATKFLKQDSTTFAKN